MPEAMLVSTKLSPRDYFADLHAVVVDEIHAFAGDDRGWHLLAVLERLQRLAGRPLQRVGLSATVGNPDQLLRWLQGSQAGARPSTVVAPKLSGSAHSRGEVTLDCVGSLSNAAKVIAALHHGEKRLVFCESRKTVEDLAMAPREHGVQTFVSHSSLSRDERRRAEQAFAESRDCVIVSTSTLELGIDVGDLDRVIQIDAPATVASFLQRFGRTGRRQGSTRNALVLATSSWSLLRAAGLLLLWTRGYVEPVTPPPAPRHIAAQQLLALCLQEGRAGENTWPEWWNGLDLHDESTGSIARWLVDEGYLERDSGMLFIGPEAEQRYGRRNFLELLSVFTAAPEFAVLAGRSEIGSIDPFVLSRDSRGPTYIALAGRTWTVTHVDWRRKRCFVEPATGSARARWIAEPSASSFALCRAQRDVLLGATPDVVLSRRATGELESLREEWAVTVAPDSTVVCGGDDAWWWTWAGARANATLGAALPDIVESQRYDDLCIKLKPEVTREDVDAARRATHTGTLPLPEVTERAVRGLKFAEVLPGDLAKQTVAARSADVDGAHVLLERPIRFLAE